MQRTGSAACGSEQDGGKQHLDLDMMFSGHQTKDKQSRVTFCSLAWGLVEFRSPSPG